MGKIKKNAVAKTDKKMSARYIKELRKLIANMYYSAKNLHSEICESLSNYLSSSFGYAPGRGRFPDDECLLR